MNPETAERFNSFIKCCFCFPIRIAIMLLTFYEFLSLLILAMDIEDGIKFINFSKT